MVSNSIMPRTSQVLNSLLEEVVLISEELYVSKMNSSNCMVTPCRALAKSLLKSDRWLFLMKMDVLLRVRRPKKKSTEEEKKIQKIRTDKIMRLMAVAATVVDLFIPVANKSKKRSIHNFSFVNHFKFVNSSLYIMVLNSMIVASSLYTPSSPFFLLGSCNLFSSLKTISKQSPTLIHTHLSLNRHLSFTSKTKRALPSVCFFNAGDKSDSNFQDKESGSEWPILRRWEVPWEWQTVSLTSLACGLGFLLTGLVEATALPYLGIKPDLLSLDEKAEILFFDQSITTAVILGIIYGVANTFQPLPEDFFKYDWRQPFNLQKGWLLWAGIGLVGAILSIALTGVAVSFFNGETPQRETDALVRLLPLIGSSNLSTAYLLGITGVLAPLLEETVFRGFLMTSLTKWVPTPVAVFLSAAVFALAHLTPGEFPQLFVLGTALGFSYAQTHNLLTPITIHAFWNSGVILLLTFLQLQGYDIKELLQTT
ncbi:hypothetical protein RJT34_02676 [Clitoria ternatea]|uniref:CAAX prenyl protease 2/Lysostaphin resistance protein A-like domain-containing protein n=1 Tax=Clitoria ternatea TaxID=43366 RepID=A0AAN9Q0H3_CLITE